MKKKYSNFVKKSYLSIKFKLNSRELIISLTFPILILFLPLPFAIYLLKFPIYFPVTWWGILNLYIILLIVNGDYTPHVAVIGDQMHPPGAQRILDDFILEYVFMVSLQTCKVVCVFVCFVC